MLDKLTLSHFSAKRVTAVEPSNPVGKRWDKPAGFWVSVDGGDDWESWCIAEDFAKERLAIRHRVTLAPNANILLLNGPFSLDAFTREYRVDTSSLNRDRIDWKLVGERYDGIIIAPYVWSRRLDGDCGWYYNWDCASGCIWQPRAVASIEVITDLLREAA
jgi:hypothetical protein